MKLARLAVAFLAPLLLAACVLQPGKFASALTVKADRSFTFAYKGEVIAIDPAEMMSSSLATSSSDDGDGEAAADRKAEKAKEAGENEAKRKAIAEALMKEEGYRAVTYLGGGKYLIDYEISGKLDHGFVYPFNSDAEVLFPFIAIELRKDGLVRVSAPAFVGSTKKAGGAPGMPSSNDAVDGSFTLTTDAEITMHNNEAGAQPGPGGMKTLSWRVTPISKDAPTAALRLAR
ncbi:MULTISPECIES: hypothetical protein [Sphingomonas]|uniref:Uncharacterized protein n=1 Tax=Edaphosphingomonas fennica TaxID=114404 RepID=A0A2T4I011_9SPHN|nr:MULTISPECIES: hypothetical protein [Sphingomonas]AGH49962.1 hypothetical protein G432_11195 [Sphingomonas sp. MM-1]MDX3883176.1 hypothetical protein [Sphingomonas sp.]PTD22008.1 hypothetical protein CV103_09500 [Sphingomonas fennica]